MTDSRVAPGLDRLPWLPDEPSRGAKPMSGLLGWAAAAILLVAGGSYWVGLRSSNEAPLPAAQSTARPETTVHLPQPASPTVAPPVVEPIVARPIPIIEPRESRPRPAPVERVRPEEVVAPPATQTGAGTEAPPAVVPEAPRPASTGPWPVRVVDGASGRLVRVGTFRTVRQAKKGWWAIVKMNPALKGLPALVVPVASLRDGGLYYRLQMGTTSQAHSQVLCQRMRMIAQSCVVIDERRGVR
jgi:hypothetical protein